MRSLEKGASAARYDLKIEELRIATEQDKSRIAAQRAFMQGEALRGQVTAEALQSAIKKYEQALLLYSAVGERSSEAITLNNIGDVCDFLGEKQKALAAYEQALTLTRAIRDQAGEAKTLNSLGLVYDSLGEKRKALDYLTQARPWAYERYSSHHCRLVFNSSAVRLFGEFGFIHKCKCRIL